LPIAEYDVEAGPSATATNDDRLLLCHLNLTGYAFATLFDARAALAFAKFAASFAFASADSFRFGAAFVAVAVVFTSAFFVALTLGAGPCWRGKSPNAF
jgi:hypothetical protein